MCDQSPNRRLLQQTRRIKLLTQLVDNEIKNGNKYRKGAQGTRN